MPRIDIGMRLRFRLERFVELGPFYRIAGPWVLLLLLAWLTARAR